MKGKTVDKKNTIFLIKKRLIKSGLHHRYQYYQIRKIEQHLQIKMNDLILLTRTETVFIYTKVCLSCVNLDMEFD